MNPQLVDLLVNGNATSAPMFWPGGEGDFTVVGTFGGGTVTLQYLDPAGSGTWVTAGTNTTLTSPGNGVALIPTGMIRALVSGGAPAGIYASFAAVID